MQTKKEPKSPVFATIKRVISRFGTPKKGKRYPDILDTLKGGVAERQHFRHPKKGGETQDFQAHKKAGFLSAATVGCSSEAWLKQGKPQISQSLKRTTEQRANREKSGLFGWEGNDYDVGRAEPADSAAALSAPAGGLSDSKGPVTDHEPGGMPPNREYLRPRCC